MQASTIDGACRCDVDLYVQILLSQPWNKKDHKNTLYNGLKKNILDWKEVKLRTAGQKSDKSQENKFNALALKNLFFYCDEVKLHENGLSLTLILKKFPCNLIQKTLIWERRSDIIKLNIQTAG